MSVWLLVLAAVIVWAGAIAAPLVRLYVSGHGELPAEWSGGRSARLLWDTLKPAAIIAALAVLLGYAPGRLLATAGRAKAAVFACLMMPLLLPKYALLYAWQLLLAPTSALGRMVASHDTLDRYADPVLAGLTMVLWYWPLAALLVGQGLMTLDRDVLASARLEAGPWRRFWHVEGRLMLRPIALAFGVCLVLTLSEFATFHLAQMQTIGSALGVLNEEVGWADPAAEAIVARAAWPLVAAAVAMGLMLWWRGRSWYAGVTAGPDPRGCSRWLWAWTGLLVGLSVLVPVGLLVGNLDSAGAIGDLLRVHPDKLLWSAVTACVSAVLAMLLAGGTVAASGLGRAGRVLSTVLGVSILVAMFLPGALVGTAILKVFVAAGGIGWVHWISQRFFIVSLAQAVRFAGVALIILLFVRSARSRSLSDAAAVDGASPRQAFLHVHLPRTWPAVAGAFVVVAMLSMTELAASKLLLPPGLPSFAMFLLNQMHSVRQQDVVAACLVLIGSYVVIGGLVVACVRLARSRATRTAAVMIVMCLAALGCESAPTGEGGVRVRGSVGRTGSGPGEFVYPRAIARAADGSVFVVDKTGRVQRFNADGEWMSSFPMPEIETGKPTGISVGPDGDLYVADTHYHRVMIFSPAGELRGQFGRYGTGPGEFIYPTDVAFAPDGRIYVSEYGGNDRVSVFSPAREFLFSFGTFGNGPGELSRPSALCVDAARARLYVADACNHRIAQYNLDGRLRGYIASAGTGAGQLRYPYDLALLEGGRLLVCEYGNNRLQAFDPEGESLGVFGGPGRRLGQLAYPWGVVVDDAGRALVLDAGNNRLQIWQLGLR